MSSPAMLGPGAPPPPHDAQPNDSTSPTQMLSQELVQQKVSCAQTHASMAPLEQPVVLDVEQQLPVSSPPVAA